ncbi:MAG: tetratricopeptide repeat protein [Rhodospirillaceae bacterium]
MLILALAIMPPVNAQKPANAEKPVNAQKFEPDYYAGYSALNKVEIRRSCLVFSLRCDTARIIDYETALMHFKPLAEEGHPLAQSRLGQMHENGWGVTKDENEAVNWYRKAAQQGIAMAQFSLGYMYDQGRGISKDFVMAYVMYNLSAKNGSSIAKDWRKTVEAKLDNSERRLALKLSKLCLEKPAECPGYMADVEAKPKQNGKVD